MSVVTAAMIAQLATACHPAAPAWMLPRIQATAAVESGGDPYAIGDNTGRQTYHPATAEQAARAAAGLISIGHSVDLGLMQINSANLARTGLTVASAFDTQANVCAGVQITAEAERATSCRYNTGRPDCTNGYPERILAALQGAPLKASARAAAAAPSPQADPGSVFLRPAPQRMLDLSER